MKSIFRLLAITFLFLVFTSPAQADGIPLLFGWGGEKIIKIMDFPDTPEFQRVEGHYIDAGVVYKQIDIFYIPIWNYDIRWCGYIGSDDNYLEIDYETLSAFAEAANLTLPRKPPLPLKDSVGGKLLLGFILLAFILIRMASSKS